MFSGSGTLTGQKVTEDKELSDLQDQVGENAGGLVGKGGIGEGIGSTLSKGL